MIGYDPYEVIGVPRWMQDDAEIERAYHARLRELPPDADPTQRHLITQAYQTINTQERRISYNLNAFYGNIDAPPATPPTPAFSPESTWGEILGGELRELFAWLRFRFQQGYRLRTVLTVVASAALSLVEPIAPLFAAALVLGLAMFLWRRTKRLYAGTPAQQFVMGLVGGALGYGIWFGFNIAAEYIVTGLIAAAILIIGIPLVLLWVFARALGGSHTHYHIYD